MNACKIFGFFSKPDWYQNKLKPKMSVWYVFFFYKSFKLLKVYVALYKQMKKTPQITTRKNLFQNLCFTLVITMI